MHENLFYFKGVLWLLLESNGDSHNIVSASIGNYKTYRAALKLEDNSNDFSYSIIASANSTQGLDQPFSEITTDSDYLSYVGQEPGESLAGKLAIGKYYAGAHVNYKNLIIDFNYNESSKGTFDGGPSRDRGNRIKTSATNLFLKYNKDVTEELSVNTAFGYYVHSHMLQYDLFFDYYYEIDYQRTSSIDYDVNIKWQPNDNINLLTGLYRRTVLSIDQLSDFGYYGLNLADGKSGLPKGETFSTNALYSQFTAEIAAKLTLNTGFRLEKLESYSMYNVRGIVTENISENRSVIVPSNRQVIEAMYEPKNNGLIFMPRIALIYEVLPKQFLKVIFSTAKRQASFSEEYRQLPQNRPALNASEIQSSELIYYNTAVKNLIITVSGFHNILDQLIVNTNNFDPTSGEWQYYATNSGKTKTIGFEYLINYKPTTNLRIKSSGTLQHTRDLREGYKNIEAAYSPNFLSYTNIMYSLNNTLRFSLNLRYISSMQSEWLSETTPENGKRIGAATKANLISDINFRYDNFIENGFFLNFKINNVLNRQIRYPTTISNTWIDRGALDFGFQALLSIGKLF